MHWIALLPQPESAPPVNGAADSHAGHVGSSAVVSGVATVDDPDPMMDLIDPLTALGWWALQFTPKVALSSGAVLLEVSSSTRLWGGQVALLRHIYMSNKPVALMAYGQGDTSLVALARAHQAQKPSLLPDQLPLTSLLAAQPHLATLARLGCTRWGQLRALPRAGVARRFGAVLVDALDQAYGQRPDVYPWLTLPEVFEAALELPHQIESAAALLFGARRLLAQLQVWLQLRQRGVLAVELGWQMDARRNTATRGALVLRTAEAGADIRHLQRLLAERLGQVMLPAPVLSLRLRSLETQPLPGVSASLLLDDQPQGDNLTQLLERLSARLGAHNVLCLQPLADHRPEQMQAWIPAVGSERAAATAAGRPRSHQDTHEFIAFSPFDTRARGPKDIKTGGQVSSPPAGWASALLPTWLLAEPLPLRVHQQQPHYQGALTLLAGPQRLEAGWWSVLLSSTGPAVFRDYFVARSDNSPLLWIYRERLASIDPAQSAPVWFLHGVFA
jgi:protein ImuB